MPTVYGLFTVLKNIRDSTRDLFLNFKDFMDFFFFKFQGFFQKFQVQLIIRITMILLQVYFVLVISFEIFKLKCYSF